MPPIPNRPKFLANQLDWPVIRRDRKFQVYVVEPGQYEPKNHARIFEAAINVFIERRPEPVDLYSRGGATAAVPFDLVTFPEAFLPSDRLIDLLNLIGRLDSFGCVHVGLRPSENPSHLFLTHELSAFLEKLKLVPGIVQDDLGPFSGWLGVQNKTHRFNIGCLFTVDAEQRVRVCLHPKMVPSKVEVSPLEEGNMEEANLLTVVTLHPTDKLYKTVTIQPLLCSDALHLDTSHGDSRPLEAMQRDASFLGSNPPDHIDIVSVATCTPQVLVPNGKSSYRKWHQEFLKTFERAASDDALARHHFATFVLSNFQMVSQSEPGGLSGAFVPLPVGKVPFPDFVTLSCWGKPKNFPENRWSTPEEDCVTMGEWSTRGYIASLNPFGEKPDAVARIFGFTVYRLPRDRSLWSTTPGLTSCTVRIGADQGAPPALGFAS